MSNQDINNELNPLEKQIKEINEFQDNASNPGYFVGSSKVSVLMRNLFKSPIGLLVIGVMAAPAVYSLFRDFNIKSIVSSPIVIVISGGLVINGIIKILKRG